MFPEPNFKEWMFFVSAAITMMLGSVPQQDVFQRVMSAKDAPTARNGAVIGACVICLCVRADVHRNLQFADHAQRSVPLLESESDSQKVLPKMILERMPFFRTVLFFGALVSAIKSCSSATLLAPATSSWKTFCVTCGPAWTIVICSALCVSRYSSLPPRC